MRGRLREAQRKGIVICTREREPGTAHVVIKATVHEIPLQVLEEVVEVKEGTKTWGDLKARS